MMAQSTTILLQNDILIEIQTSLTKMESDGKVDLSILAHLSKLRNHLNDIKSKWMEIDDSQGFYFYQATRNMEFVLERMIYRFKTSQKKNDNPKIVNDSFSLLPIMDKMLEITQHYEINEHTINEALSGTRDLRNLARNANLIEPLEISRARIDKDSIKLHLPALLKSLGSTETSFYNDV